MHSPEMPQTSPQEKPKTDKAPNPTQDVSGVIYPDGTTSRKKKSLMDQAEEYKEYREGL